MRTGTVPVRDQLWFNPTLRIVRTIKDVDDVARSVTFLERGVPTTCRFEVLQRDWTQVGVSSDFATTACLAVRDRVR